MQTTNHVYSTVAPTPAIGDCKIDPEALLTMRARTAEFPNARWAAFQCVDLGAWNIGHLKFCAVGPENTVKCVDRPCLLHWSYYFIGFVDLGTGKSP